MTITMECAKLAHVTLLDAFMWAHSPQGDNYWHDVYVRLLCIAEGKDTSPQKPPTIIAASWNKKRAHVRPERVYAFIGIITALCPHDPAYWSAVIVQAAEVAKKHEEKGDPE